MIIFDDNQNISRKFQNIMRLFVLLTDARNGKGGTFSQISP